MSDKKLGYPEYMITGVPGKLNKVDEGPSWFALTDEQKLGGNIMKLAIGLVMVSVLLCASWAFGDVIQLPNQANMQRSNVPYDFILADRFQIGSSQWAFWVTFWGSYSDHNGPNSLMKDFTVAIWKDDGTGQKPADGSVAGDIIASYTKDLNSFVTGNTILGGWDEYEYRMRLDNNPIDAIEEAVQLDSDIYYWLLVYHNSDDQWAWERSSTGDNVYAAASSITPAVTWTHNSGGDWAWAISSNDVPDGPVPMPISLTTIPEPATLALLVLGSLPMLWRRRR